MQDAKQDAHGCSSGQGSQLSGQSGLLVAEYPGHLSPGQIERLEEVLKSVGEPMNLRPLILGGGVTAHVAPAGLDVLIQEMRANTASNNRIAASVEALVQAMAEAEGVDPEDVPATVGLNGRPL